MPKAINPNGIERHAAKADTMLCLAENCSIGNAEFNRNRAETLIEYKLEHFFCHSPSTVEE